MTNKRDSRSSKTKQERTRYFQTIRATSSSATVDDSLAFSGSDKEEPIKEISDTTRRPRRSVPALTKIKGHFEKHLIIYIFAAIGVIFTYVYTLNREVGQLDVRVQYISEAIKDTKQNVDRLFDALISQGKKVPRK